MTTYQVHFRLCYNYWFEKTWSLAVFYAISILIPSEGQSMLADQINFTCVIIILYEILPTGFSEFNFIQQYIKMKM